MTEAQQATIERNKTDMAAKGVTYKELWSSVQADGKLALKAELTKAGKMRRVIFDIGADGKILSFTEVR